MRYLSKQVEILEEKCAGLMDGTDGLKKKVERFQQVCGIGKVTAMGMGILMPELGTLSDKVAAKLVGVAPVPNESGAWKGARTIQRGRFRARLFATRFPRTNPTPKKFFHNAVAHFLQKFLRIVIAQSTPIPSHQECNHNAEKFRYVFKIPTVADTVWRSVPGEVRKEGVKG